MSEEAYTEYKDWSTIKKNQWPPTEDNIQNIAIAALNKSHDKDVSVLIYLDNPKLMIFNPLPITNTKFITNNFKHNERTIKVTIGQKSL